MAISAVEPIMGGFIASRVGWRWNFWVLAIVVSSELEGPIRTVLTKQCEDVNAKLMTLKAMINGGRQDPKKPELLQKIYNARGDESSMERDPLIRKHQDHQHGKRRSTCISPPLTSSLPSVQRDQRLWDLKKRRMPIALTNSAASWHIPRSRTSEHRIFLTTYMIYITMEVLRNNLSQSIAQGHQLATSDIAKTLRAKSSLAPSFL